MSGMEIHDFVEERFQETTIRTSTGSVRTVVKLDPAIG